MSDKINIKKILAIGFGANILEWYDFSIYVYLSNTLGLLFFDEAHPKLAFIKALFIFSLSFLVRPIGSIFFGYIGDRYGRRASLQLSLVMMAFPTLFIGLLPTYTTLGIGAVILLILFRMIQGFAAGGELPAVACYLYEVAPKHQRNFFCSLGAASSTLGVLLGSCVVYLLHVIFTENQIQAWGWRLPFWLGSILILLVFQIRKTIDETSTFKAHRIKSIKEYMAELVAQRKQVTPIFLLNSFIAIAFYLLFVWMPSYLLVFNNIPANLAFFSSSFGLSALICITLIVGFIAKESDQKKWMITGLCLMIIFSYPLFQLLGLHSLANIFIAQLLFAAALGCVVGVINATMGNTFDDHIRCSGISIGYSLPVAIFGGLVPTICSILIYNTGVKTSPILFLVISALIALSAVIKLPTRGQDCP